MPNKCTICRRPDYNQFIALLKNGQSINSVSVRFAISYDSLARCFREHTTFTQEESVIQEVKKAEKQLAQMDKNKTISPGSIEYGRVRTHLANLRAELRELAKIRRETAPELLPDGSQPLTVQALDKIIREYRHSPIDGERDAKIRDIEHQLRFTVPHGECLRLCAEIETLIRSWMSQPTLHQAPLQPRTMRSN